MHLGCIANSTSQHPLTALLTLKDGQFFVAFWSADAVKQHPQVSFQIFEWSHQGVPMLLFQILLEAGIAKADVDRLDVLKLLDFDCCFKLLQIPLPTDQPGILGKLADETLIVQKPGSRFDITNLGAILFATDLNNFERLGRKALRIIKYTGDGRTDTESLCSNCTWRSGCDSPSCASCHSE